MKKNFILPCLCILAFSLFFYTCVDELNLSNLPDSNSAKMTIDLPLSKANTLPYKVNDEVIMRLKFSYAQYMDSLIIDWGEQINPKNYFREALNSTGKLEKEKFFKFTTTGDKRVRVLTKLKEAGKTRDTTITLNVGIEPKITDNQIKCRPSEVILGSACTLYAEVSEFGDTEYSWLKNDQKIQTTATKRHIINSVTNSHIGKYVLTVKNLWGSATSEEFILVIATNPKPQIIVQPQDIQTTVGKSAIFVCQAIPETATCQWLKNGVLIESETKTTYVIREVKIEDNQTKFRCRVSTTGGSVESKEATLSVFDEDQKIVITKHPENIAIDKGERALFSVEATGTNKTYQWQKNAADIANATQKTYQTDPVTEADNAIRFRCKISNNLGPELSKEATLTVLSTDISTKPQIIAQPSDVETTDGQDAVFIIVAIGKDLKYQWKKK